MHWIYERPHMQQVLGLLPVRVLYPWTTLNADRFSPCWRAL